MRNALILVGALIFLANTTHAGRLNSLAPPEESVCSGLSGAAWGLCYSYCEVKDCDGEFPRGSSSSCEKIARNFERKFGALLPCEDPSNDLSFSFAVISDSHVKGPKDPRDKPFYPSIETSIERFEDVITELNMSSKFDFIVHTGDHVNDLYCPLITTKDPPYPWDACWSCDYKKYDLLTYGCCRCEFNCYGGHKYGTRKWHPYCPPRVLLEYAGYVKESSHFGPVPLYIVLGNHDDRYLGSVVIRDHAKDEFNRMFGLSNGTPVMSPFRYDQVQFENYRAGCYDFDYKGFHFIILDSTADPFSSNDAISFGGEQLRWLDSKLRNNSKPAILFWHKNPTGEIESVPSPDDPHFDHGKYEYLEVLYPYRARIRFVFVGHSHRFAKYAWQGIKFRETTSTMCSEDIGPVPVYYTVTCHPDDGTVEVNDEDIFDNPYSKDVTKACQAY